MRKYFCLVIMIMFLGLVGFLAGCRAKLDTSSSTLRRQTDVIGLELHKLDSLWRSMSERQTLKIEFYEPNNLDCFVPRNDAKRQNDIPEVRQNLCYLQGSKEAAPDVFMPAAQSHREGAILPAGGGMGAVKSIEISTEKVEGVSSITTTDSTYNYMKGDEHARDVSTVSEARQDNGTVATIAIVFAVAALIYLVIKSMLK